MSEGLTFSSVWDILLLETKVSDEDSALSKVSPRELALAGSFFMSKQTDGISTFFSTSDNSTPYPALSRVLTYALQRGELTIPAVWDILLSAVDLPLVLRRMQSRSLNRDRRRKCKAMFERA